MHNSRLLALCKMLYQAEIKAFGLFVQSPFFNQNTTVIALWQLIADVYPNLSDLSLNKETVATKLFADKIPDKRESFLRKTMSELSHLLLQFLAYQQQQTDSYNQHHLLLNALIARNGLDLFAKEWKNTETDLLQDTQIDALYYQHNFILHSHYYNYLLLVNNRHPEAHKLRPTLLQKLDVYYVIEKLRWLTNLLSSNAILQSYTPEQRTDFVQQTEALLQLADTKQFGDIPLVNLYCHAARLFIAPNNNHYQLFIQQLSALGKAVSSLELSVLYKFGLNYCSQQITSGQSNMWEQIDELYHKMLHLEILLENGQLLPVQFKNIVTTKHRLKKYDEAQTFIETYKSKLPKSEQLVATYLNGQTSFYLKQYANALSYLAETELTDSIDRIQVNMLQVKCFWGLLYDKSIPAIINKLRNRQQDAATNKLNAFDEYLKSHKGINNDKRLAYRNFVRLTRRLFTLYEKQKIGTAKDKLNLPEQITQLKQDIANSTALIDTDWLLSKVVLIIEP